MNICGFSACSRPARKRGYCNTHYERLRLSGQIQVREKDPVARFWSRVDKTDTCWNWTGGLSHGYGYTSFDGRVQGAHRVSFQLIAGRIPEGLELDHLCRNRRCVNPVHLEPVTSRVNLLRGEGMSAKNAAKTHCPQGHEYTVVNTYLWRGNRLCAACRDFSDKNRTRPMKSRVAISATCKVCKLEFQYVRGSGGRPRTMCLSERCHRDDARRRSREYQQRKRATGSL